jgi:flagellar hook-associated protein 1 FlgK
VRVARKTPANGAAGLDLFKGTLANGADGLPVGVTAAGGYKGMVNAMGVNSAILANPKLVAASGAAPVAGIPVTGDNANAKAMAKLQTATATVDTDGDGLGDSGPFSTVVASLANRVGTQAQEFKTTATNQENLTGALQTQRDRLSAVDLDEEAARLITFQRGYQASARFINVISQLTDQLVNGLGK